MSAATIPQLFAQTLTSLLPIFAYTLPLSDASTQSLLTTSLDKLYLIYRTLQQVGVWSENESVHELSERSLLFTTVPWVIGACEEKRTDDRKQALQNAETTYKSYIDLLSQYKIVTPNETQEYLSSSNPEKKRETKIAQYKKEKQLEQKISAIATFSGKNSPISFIIAILQSFSDDDSSNADSPHLRQTTLDVLSLLHSQALSALSTITMELDILASAPSIPLLSNSDTARDKPRQESTQDTTWRLDSLPPSQLIGNKGKILRPFTLLPSGQTQDKERLKKEVFRESWRLPTMSIDEYLEIERQRGGIISGGGQASYDAPTAAEQLALETEQDGTIGAHDADEKKRKKDENWAVYTEENAKGAGNTMNRG
ncbi:hypothetical protein L204_101797 [Cryptococcus depauperatus]